MKLKEVMDYYCTHMCSEEFTTFCKRCPVVEFVKDHDFLEIPDQSHHHLDKVRASKVELTIESAEGGDDE